MVVVLVMMKKLLFLLGVFRYPPIQATLHTVHQQTGGKTGGVINMLQINSVISPEHGKCWNCLHCSNQPSSQAQLCNWPNSDGKNPPPLLTVLSVETGYWEHHALHVFRTVGAVTTLKQQQDYIITSLVTSWGSSQCLWSIGEYVGKNRNSFTFFSIPGVTKLTLMLFIGGNNCANLLVLIK